MSPLRAFLLVLLSVVLVGAALFDAAAPASCRDYNRQLDAGLIKQATNGYTAILEDEPGSTCATDGLLRVGKIRCSQAQSVLGAGATTEAKALFVALLASEPPEPSVSCAVDGLKKISRQNAASAASGGKTRGSGATGDGGVP